MTLEINQENKEQNMCTEGLGAKTRAKKKSSCEDDMIQHLDYVGFRKERENITCS